jgi:hypothetical protein
LLGDNLVLWDKRAISSALEACFIIWLERTKPASSKITLKSLKKFPA